MVRARGADGVGPMMGPLFCWAGPPVPNQSGGAGRAVPPVPACGAGEESVALWPSVGVERDYSPRRSIRRGATTHALNRGILAEVVDATNRWRKAEQAGNRDPSLA
jgi:hypothetical protein